MADKLIRVGPTASGGDAQYATLGTAITSEKAGFEADTGIWTFECEAFSDSGYSQPIILNYTGTTGTHYIHIKPQAGAEHGGNWGSGYRLSVNKSNGAALHLDVTTSHSRVDGIIIENSGGAAGAGIFSYSGHSQFINCMIRPTASVDVDTPTVTYTGSTPVGVVMRNCVIVGRVSFNCLSVAMVQPVLQNCVIDAFDNSVNALHAPGAGNTDPQPVCKNCIFINGTSISVHNWYTGTDWENCVTDDAVALGTSPLSSIDPATAFVDAANNDYRPAPGGVLDGANNPGVDLSADPTWPFDYDITGATRG